MRFYLLDVKNYLDLSSLLFATVALMMMNLPPSMILSEGSFSLTANSILAVGVMLLCIGQVMLCLVRRSGGGRDADSESRLQV